MDFNGFFFAVYVIITILVYLMKHNGVIISKNDKLNIW